MGEQHSEEERPPFEPFYFGWLVWIAIGLFGVYRGAAVGNALTVVAAGAFAAVGAVALVLSAVEKLRPWRKRFLIGFTCVIVLVIVVEAYLTMGR